MAAPLTYSVGADVSKFESAMSRARDTALRHSADMLRSFQTTASGINTAFSGVAGLGNLPAALERAKAAALGLAATGAAIVGGYALVSAAITQANAQLDRFIKLGEDASKAGVGVELFQRFSEAAEKAKLDVNEVATALQNARSAVTPKLDQTDPIRSRLADIFESGYHGDIQTNAVNDYRRAGTDEERIRAAVKAMQELLAIGDRLAALDIAEKLFGAAFADRIRTGRIEVDAIVAALDRERPDLITQEQVRQAQEFRDRLDTAYKTIDDFLHVSVALEGSGRALAQIWLDIAEGVASATTNVGNFVTKLREAEGEAAKGILGKLFGEKYGELAKLLIPNYGATVYQIATGAAGAAKDNVAAQVTGERVIYDKPIGPEQPAPKGNVITNPPEPPRRPLSFYTDQREAPPARGSTGSQSLDQIETFINGLERTTAGLKGEVEAIGLSNEARQVSINLRKAEELAQQQGRALTADEIRRIRETSAAAAEARDSLEKVHEQQEFIRGSAGDFLKGFADNLRNGKSAAEALSDAIGRLAARLEDKTLDSLADLLFGKAGGNSFGLAGGRIGGVFGFRAKAEEGAGVGDQRVPVHGRRGDLDGRGRLHGGRDARGDLVEGGGAAAPERGACDPRTEPVPAADGAQPRDGGGDLRRSRAAAAGDGGGQLRAA